MADNKKYYYLKLKEDFFETDEAVVLESMADGYIYTNILLKLYLRSLKNNGLLMFNNLIPYNAQMLATITRHPIGVVEKAVKIFNDLQLIDILDNGAIYMTNIQNFVGKSSTDADRKRLARGIGQMSTKRLEKTPPEIEIEKELEQDIELETDISSSSCINNKKDSYTVQQLLKDFEAGFGRLLSPFEIEDIQKHVNEENFKPELIREALKEGVYRGKPVWNYIKGVLRNWKADNILTVEQVRAKQQEQELKVVGELSDDFIAAMDMWKD